MATNTTPTAEHVQKLRVMVERSASRWKQLIILEALGLVIAAPLAYLWLVFILDNMFHLPRWGRIVASLGFVVALIFLVASLVKRWRKIHFTEDQVALAMESQTPGVQNRLINAIQLSRDQSVDAGFSQAVIEENYARLQQIEVHQAAQVRPAVVRIGVAAIVILFGVGFFVFQGEHFKNAMARIMMPFADVDPIYQTVLRVEQGPLQKNHDVTIKVSIKGRTPSDLTILKVIQGERATESVQVGQSAKEVTYTFKGVEKSMTYAVRGNDYLTEYYRIDVPTPSTLSSVKVTYQFPAYTKLPEKMLQTAGGDLEALLRTKATVHFLFDQPADEATMLLQKLMSNATPKATGNPATKPSAAADAVQRIALKKISPTEFAGEITFVDVISYQLETLQPKQPPHLSGRYALRVRADQDPTLELSGLGKQTDTGVDAVLPVSVTASDDYGLDKVGLFARKVVSASASLQTDVNAAPPTDEPDSGWKPVEVWPANGVLEFKKDHGLSIAAIGAIEGEKYEVVLRASDTDPDKKGMLHTADAHVLLIGGDGATLQLLYEQIIQSEKDLKAVVAAQQAGIDAANIWIQKLEPASGLRWDDKANLDALTAAMKEQSGEEVKVRTAAGRVARDMVEQAGSLRMGLGMLADTEMVRAISILEAVPNRDNPQEKRAALADGRLTQERTLRSMKEMLEQYVRFRQDWEFSNMIPFVKMLADRQASMRDEATKRVGQPASPTDAARQASTGKRQMKLGEMVGLSQVAFTGMVDRVKDGEPILAKAFTEASAALGASELKNPMNEAAEHAKAGRWAEAAKAQDTAALALAAIHDKLHKAQLEAAKAALAAVKDLESKVKKQEEIKDLAEGDTESKTDPYDEKAMSLEDILRMRQAAEQKNKDGGILKPEDYVFSDDMLKSLSPPDGGKRQDPSVLKLGNNPNGIGSFPNSSDRAANKVGKPPIQEKFEDLQGELLAEADNNYEKWETYNLTTTFNINEPGDIGKQGGDMNSTAAAAATGNQKQPPHDFGGLSRSGRDGARSHGGVVGDEDKNLQGMDKPQEGAERSPDQEGRMKSKKGDDPDRATATGMGGKTVEDDSTRFNDSNKGHFTEDMAKRMEKPQAKNSLVERQDGFVDPKLAEMLRDLTGTQEQLIERVKAIKKELQMLYQPTEQIDEALKQLQANLESLKERPTADVFKLQMQTLDKLRQVVRVFSQPGSNFTPSLPRDQTVKGRVLDDPARQTMPGYEEAVKQYYQMLSQQ